MHQERMLLFDVSCDQRFVGHNNLCEHYLNCSNITWLHHNCKFISELLTSHLPQCEHVTLKEINECDKHGSMKRDVEECSQYFL